MRAGRSTPKTDRTARSSSLTVVREGRRLQQLEAAHFSDLERLTLKHANALPWDPERPAM